MNKNQATVQIKATDLTQLVGRLAANDLKQLVKGIIQHNPNVTLLRDMNGPVDVMTIDDVVPVAIQASTRMVDVTYLWKHLTEFGSLCQFVSLYTVQYAAYANSSPRLFIRGYFQ